MNLRWTAAGLAALADAANTGTAKLKLTHLAIGDGQGAGGAADDGRAALRSERHRAAIQGTDATAAGRIAFRADFAPDADYGITEAGVFGTAGDPPSKAALYLYWTDGGAKAGQAANGTALAIGATVDFQAAAADVAVTVGGKIEFGDPPGNATELKFGLTRYATADETDGASGERAVTPKGLRAKFGALLARLIGKQAADGTIYQLKGKSDGTLAIEERTRDAATATALAGLRRSVQANSVAVGRKADSSDLPGAATTAKKGIVELATDAEAKAGTDTERAVTPKALKAATDALSVPAAPAAATTAKKGIVELATDAEAKAGTDTERAVTPKAMKAAAASNIGSLLASGSIEAGKSYALKGKQGGGLELSKLALATVMIFTTDTILNDGAAPVQLGDTVSLPAGTYALAAAGYWTEGRNRSDTGKPEGTLSLEWRASGGSWAAVPGLAVQKAATALAPGTVGASEREAWVIESGRWTAAADVELRLLARVSDTRRDGAHTTGRVLFSTALLCAKAV